MKHSERVKLDTKALKEWVLKQDMTMKDMGYMLGKSKSYFSNLCCGYTADMSPAIYDLFLRTFNLPDGSFIYHEPVTPPKKNGAARNRCAFPQSVQRYVLA